MVECPFCAVSPSRILLESESAIAIFDGFPVSQGHTLVLPRRHVPSVYDLTSTEQQALWDLVAATRSRLLSDFNVDGFNIGFNDGFAAGQTIDHAHIHVIPRRHGDISDPRGGIRWIIADKARYWLD